MGFLETVGIGAIIFIIYKYVIKPRSEQIETENSVYIEKVKILRSRHLEIREMFKKFEKEQHESAKWAKKDHEETFEEPYYGDKGGYVNLFGRPTFVFYQHQIENFSYRINLKIRELENDPIEKQKINEIIKNHQSIVKKQNEQSEIKLLERRKNYLKYKDLMNEIFPNTKTKFTKEELIEMLRDKLKLSGEEGNRIFTELTNYETGIIFKNLASKNFEPALLHNITPQKRQKLKASVSKYYENLKNKIKREPTFKEFIIDFIKNSNESNTAKIYNVLVEGWEVNNYKDTNFDKVYKEIFRDRIETYWYDEWQIKGKI